MPEAEYSVTTERDEEYLRLLESLGYAGGIEPEREGAAGDADGE